MKVVRFVKSRSVYADAQKCTQLYDLAYTPTTDTAFQCMLWTFDTQA